MADAFSQEYSAPGETKDRSLNQYANARGRGLSNVEWGEGSRRVSSAHCGLRIANCGLRIADCGLRIADCDMTKHTSRLLSAENELWRDTNEIIHRV